MDLSFGQMSGLVGLGALGSIGSTGLGQVFTGHNMYRQYKYASRLQQQQYNLQMQGLREGYINARQGLESAGYNPILAATGGSVMPSISSGSAGAPNVSVENPVSGAANAYRAFKLEKENLKNQTLSTLAGVDNSNAQASLYKEQALTEQARRIQMDFQNAMYDVEKHLKEKELSWADKKFYSEIYDNMQRAENYGAMASIARYNAQINAQNAQTNAMNTQINADINAGNVANSKELEQWYKDHPYQAKLLRGIERYGKAAGTVLGGVGLGAAGYAAIKNANKLPLDSTTETAKFDSNGTYRGHIRTSRRLKRR